MNVQIKENPEIHPSWFEVLKTEFSLEYFIDLKKFLLQDKSLNKIYPSGNQIFSAFNYTPFDQVKVIIIGQDPYHGEGQAHGLCFSVPDGIKPPPSLVNIKKEISADLNIPLTDSGNLENWAKQGVLLLNATLTVRANQAGSHQKKGWENFTDKVIETLSEKKDGLVFLLWGRYAQEKERLIDTSRHHILKAAHPSPFSAYNGFMGCKHFSKTNEILKRSGIKEISWHI
jgi:uracil-DNA glycosylase